MTRKSRSGDASKATGHPARGEDSETSYVDLRNPNRRIVGSALQKPAASRSRAAKWLAKQQAERIEAVEQPIVVSPPKPSPADGALKRRRLKVVEVQRPFATDMAVEATQVALPAVAPELWSDRSGRKENPVKFIRRVYAPWLGKGLLRQHLRELDRPLYQAYGVWLHRNPDEAIAELPSIAEVTDSLIAQLPPGFDLELLAKLGFALRHRSARNAARKK